MTVDPSQRYVVINADDFGISRGANRGILDAHARGVVTSTSMIGQLGNRLSNFADYSAAAGGPIA